MAGKPLPKSLGNGSEPSSNNFRLLPKIIFLPWFQPAPATFGPNLSLGKLRSHVIKMLLESSAKALVPGFLNANQRRVAMEVLKSCTNEASHTPHDMIGEVMDDLVAKSNNMGPRNFSCTLTGSPKHFPNFDPLAMNQRPMLPTCLPT